MSRFIRDDLELWYGERGVGETPFVLLHGLLWSSRMQERLAADLGRDLRVLLLDLHGHGRSAKPVDASRYTFDELVADVVGLLDHLELEQAIVGGLSLGANVALAMGQRAPERASALVLEMPVLLRGHSFGRPAFNTLATVFERGSPVLRPVSGLVRRLPAPGSVADLAALRDVAGADPRVARAVLRGLLAEPVLPEDEEALARVPMPTLVVGHGRDPLHVIDDARDLASRLPRGRLVEAPNILTHRQDPGRLAGTIRSFLREEGLLP